MDDCGPRPRHDGRAPEQARRERLELEGRMAPRRRNLVIAIGLALAVAAGVGVYALTRPEASQAGAGF